MFVTLFGIEIFVRLLQPTNVVGSIFLRLEEIEMFERLKQYQNAPRPIFVTLFGMVMLESFVQLLNAPFSISVMLCGMFMVTRFVQKTNELEPIRNTPFWIVTDVIKLFEVPNIGSTPPTLFELVLVLDSMAITGIPFIAFGITTLEFVPMYLVIIA
jgi:hypothetical protein